MSPTTEHHAVSIIAIARRAGVAKSTVSLALRDNPLISEKQRKRIQKIATKMGWQPRPHLARLMSELSSVRKARYKATLAFVSAAVSDPRQVLPSGTAADWLSGAETRARQLGYGLDRFWLNDPEVSHERLAKIFWARNVQGVVLHSLDSTTRLQLRKQDKIWQQFPFVLIGSRMRTVPLNFVCNDYHSTAMEGTAQLLARGYRRIGFYMVRWLDETWEHRLVSGWRACMEAWNLETPPVFFINDPRNRRHGTDADVQLAFVAWLTEHRVEACLAVNSHVLNRLAMAGLRVPGDIGVAVLDLPKGLRGKVAGMEQQHVNTGMTAVDVVIGQLLRREAGVPPFQQGTLIESLWVPGPTVRDGGTVLRKERRRGGGGGREGRRSELIPAPPA
ncbi:LacI family DNA-binding transcriptional regulator [Geminisphaera colitermitum]|uniref:LacI family DNA-binding transcriptional regulator n=1 Tax=Geminisphaera colitermitum TaxID=1148786 RepID=UPI00019653F1|nr:LacI family DNA-binding transcriptional regulator [Geminisphaera colitermitum]